MRGVAQPVVAGRVVGVAQVENKFAAVGGGERAVDDAFDSVEIVGGQARD